MKKVFEDDLIQLLKSGFSDYNITLKANSLDDLLLDYLTLHTKVIERKKRAVKYSPTLQKKIPQHPRTPEIFLIASMFKKGDDVNCFQSDKLFHTRFHDHLLYEWNIFHFHLSMKVNPKSGFVKRTDDLLFVYVDNDQAIFLDFEKHSKGIFADTKWLEILDKYFPKILAPHLDSEIKQMWPQLSPEELQSVWDKGYTVGLTQVGDKVYRNKGIGRMASGHSINVVRTADKIMDWLWYVGPVFSELKLQICKENNLPVDNVSFRLRFGRNNLEVYDEISGSGVLEYPLYYENVKIERDVR